MSFAFDKERTRQFKALVKQYPDKRSVVLPALHLAQDQAGFLSTDTISAVAKLLGLVPAEVLDTATFYTMFFTEPKGKYLLQVCQTLSCSLLGSDQIFDHLRKKLKIEHGETTPDDKFTLLKVECLGSCGTAPVVQINDDYIESITKEKLDRLLDKLP